MGPDLAASFIVRRYKTFYTYKVVLCDDKEEEQRIVDAEMWASYQGVWERLGGAKKKLNSL